MKCSTRVTRAVEAVAGLERLKHLEHQLAAAPRASRQHRTLSTAIRIEADAYRKSLDVDQATAMHDLHPLLGVGRGSRKPRPSLENRRRPVAGFTHVPLEAALEPAKTVAGRGTHFRIKTGS